MKCASIDICRLGLLRDTIYCNRLSVCDTFGGAEVKVQQTEFMKLDVLRNLKEKKQVFKIIERIVCRQRENITSVTISP